MVLLTPDDSGALHSIAIAAVVGAVGEIAAFTAEFATGTSLISSLPALLHNTGRVYALIAAEVASAVLAIISVGYYRKGFRVLARSGGRDAGLQRPANFCIFLAIGGALVIVYDVWSLAQAYLWTTCARDAIVIPANCVPPGALAALAVGIILALVGVVALLLGVWRLGTRYAEPKFKIGVVLWIFPYVDIIGLVLIVRACRGVRARAAADRPPEP